MTRKKTQNKDTTEVNEFRQKISKNYVRTNNQIES
jgi:hypothetical protein